MSFILLLLNWLSMYFLQGCRWQRLNWGLSSLDSLQVCVTTDIHNRHASALATWYACYKTCTNFTNKNSQLTHPVASIDYKTYFITLYQQQTYWKTVFPQHVIISWPITDFLIKHSCTQKFIFNINLKSQRLLPSNVKVHKCDNNRCVSASTAYVWCTSPH